MTAKPPSADDHIAISTVAPIYRLAGKNFKDAWDITNIRSRGC